MTSRWARSIVLALMMLMAPEPGVAQQAPTGAHYGGRSSDTGYASLVTRPASIRHRSRSTCQPKEPAFLCACRSVTDSAALAPQA